MSLGSYRVSRCTTPRHSKFTWHYYSDAAGHPVVLDELRTLLDPALNSSVRIARLAELQALLDAAAMGQLVEQGSELPNVRAVMRDPELWELRWQTEDGGHWRMYHAEPVPVPGYLVSLRVHRKDLTGSSDEIRERQNDHIDVASDRYTEGESRCWGIV